MCPEPVLHARPPTAGGCVLLLGAFVVGVPVLVGVSGRGGHWVWLVLQGGVQHV
jgi:hypothetical protein